MLGLHSIVENELEAPSLAWNSLAWYWAYSFLGMGPRYKEYMTSGEWDVDKAFYGNEGNADINRIPGYDRQLTIKQRFDRAVDYFEYCCVRCRETSINPPFDLPPDLSTIIALYRTSEIKPRLPDKTIDASLADVLQDNDDYQALWEVGGQVEREERARQYAIAIKAAIGYIEAEVTSRLSLTLDQLNKETGFLTSGSVRIASGVYPEDMDEIMPEDTQVRKLGTVYKAADGTMVIEGITGRYFKAGHSVARAMYSDERIRELSGVHHAIVRTWKQLMDIGNSI